jgi:hypothetical protein
LETKHTRGPWKPRKDDYQKNAINIGPNAGETVCRITGRAAAIKEAGTNACLIASAPELLACLEEITSTLAPTLKSELHLTQSQLGALLNSRAAIKAAKG